MNESPLMRLDELAIYLRYDNAKRPVDAVRKWCLRHDVRMFKRGTVVLVRQADADRALERNARGGLDERVAQYVASKR